MLQDFQNRARAKAIANGISDGLLHTGAMLAIGFGVVGLLLWFFNGITGFGKDSTDKSAWDHSGLEILTDHATGLEYLKAGDALTPRLDRDGRQMREGE